MERDWDIIREVLLRLAAKGPGHLRVADFDEDRGASVAYNVGLLHQAGLVDAVIHKAMTGAEDFSLMQMTWEGHDLLDAIRDEKFWKKVKGVIRSKGVPMMFELVKFAALSLGKEGIEAAMSGGG